MRLSKNFTDEEFKCPCCGEFVDSLPFRAFLAKLQEARTAARTPFVVTSGYRCPKHNEAVGGSLDSSHIRGLAADIRTSDSRSRFRIVTGLIAAGLLRIGVAGTFIHVDMDCTKAQGLMWTYRYRD